MTKVFFFVERGRWRRSCRTVARNQFSKSETRELVCIFCDLQNIVHIESRWDFSSVWVWFKDCFVCFFWANTNFLVETSAGKLTPLFSNFSTTPNLQKSQFQHLKNEESLWWTTSQIWSNLCTLLQRWTLKMYNY